MSNRSYSLVLLLLFAGIFLPLTTYSGGISVAAGLTPAQQQWILRSQFRYRPLYSLEQDQLYAQQLRLPVVTAYGVRPGITIIGRTGYGWNQLRKDGQLKGVDQGMLPLTIMGKFKVYRLNTRHWIVGIAPTAGILVPLGQLGLGTSTLKAKVGGFASLRHGMWATDLNVAYRWPEAKIWKQDRLVANVALARHFILNEQATTTLAPVTEFNYQSAGQLNRPLGWGGLGVKLTIQSVILEALGEWPVIHGKTFRPGPRLLIGTRFKL